ncbi:MULTISPECIES: hypothetical protein [Asaia]|uniref:hypothetical protein n=1 Tax=Asaia TaxID=91914 RepID=UPI002FC34870
MPLTHFLEVLDKDKNLVSRHESGDKEDFAKGKSPATWDAVNSVSKGGYIRVGTDRDGETTYRKSYICVHSFSDKFPGHGTYITIPQATTKTRYFNYDDFVDRINQNILHSLFMSEVGEYYIIEKSLTDGNGEVFERIFSVERVA